MIVYGLKNPQPTTKRREYMQILFKLSPLIAFAVPLALLYILNPFDPYMDISTRASFELMWKGRTFQLFFIWLIALEFILSWETITSKINRQNTARLGAFVVALVLPTLYVVLATFAGLNGLIASSSQNNGIEFYGSMPLAIEYLVFSVLFCLVVTLSFGRKGLKGFALPPLFLLLVGILYTIDNVFPRGEFTPFQLFVPTTASLAAGVLGWMGYSAVPGTELDTGMPTLAVTGPLGTAKFAIAWPCAGIESLLIFTTVALLFLKHMHISWKSKIGYFAVGIVVTYLINILRITALFMIGAQYGTQSSQLQDFHVNYGPLYSMAWIISFPLIILATQGLWRKIKKSKNTDAKKLQLKQLDLV